MDHITRNPIFIGLHLLGVLIKGMGRKRREIGEQIPRISSCLLGVLATIFSYRRVCVGEPSAGAECYSHPLSIATSGTDFPFC